MRIEQRAFAILGCHGEKPWSSFWDTAEQKFSRPRSLIQAESVSAPQRDLTMLPHVLYWSVRCLVGTKVTMKATSKHFYPLPVDSPPPSLTAQKDGDIFVAPSSWESFSVPTRLFRQRCSCGDKHYHLLSGNPPMQVNATQKFAIICCFNVFCFWLFPVVISRPAATANGKKGDQEENEEAAVRPNLGNCQNSTNQKIEKGGQRGPNQNQTCQILRPNLQNGQSSTDRKEKNRNNVQICIKL